MRYPLCKALLAPGVFLVALQTSCTTPCQRLQNRAQECGHARATYVDERLSQCGAFHDAVGNETMENFVRCVEGAACTDTQAPTRCSQEHFPQAQEDPCERYQIWTLACGLEPFGDIETRCEQLGSSLVGSLVGGEVPEDSQLPNLPDTVAEASVDIYVQCISEEGCPMPEDSRFDECTQAVGDQDAIALIEACLIVGEWTTRCASFDNPLLPIIPQPLPMCLVEANSYQVDSYVAYAQCLEDVPCDSPGQRVLCVALLDPANDNDNLSEQCQALGSYAQSCDSLVAGGNADTCKTLFGGFTQDSMDAYRDCVLASPCDDGLGQSQCLAVLERQ